MKSQILSIEGEKLKEIELPKIFSAKVREDIIKKVFEAEKKIQPYGPNFESGKQHSASGIARHLRHVWKSGYGHGRSRVPRKIMWRRGSQFYWIGAEVSGTRGGRRAHPPKPIRMLREKKINKKEWEKAFESGISGSVNEKFIKERYERLKNIKIGNLPIIIESKIISLKTKQIVDNLKKILGEMFIVSIPERKIRAGRGKLRNRKYKKSSGVLLITGNKEEVKSSVIESKKINEVEIKDLYPLGRLAIYTENAIKDMVAEK